MEAIPIGTIITVLMGQVIKTAVAAKDVVFEKESFKVLSKYLYDIEKVLKELQLKHLNDSQAARKALEYLKADVVKADNLVEKYKNRARFYLLINCRRIVKEVQDVTRDIGKSLSTLSLVNIEVLSGISEQVNKLQNEMQRAEFETSQSMAEIVDKLSQALSDQNLDYDFANDILRDIAKAVGVDVEPSEISKEMEKFKKEKVEAENRKERAEAFFLEQVIELLSRADAAKDYEQIRQKYLQRLKCIEIYDPTEEEIKPFKALVCCITKDVMVDPVSLCTGTSCERRALESWFARGEKKDPETGEILDDPSYRSNIQLKKLIQEWRELNYCLKIQSCKAKLLSDDNRTLEEALGQIQKLMSDDRINKDWIFIAGLTDNLISMLEKSNTSAVKQKVLVNLKNIVEGNQGYKEKVVESGAFEHILPCLGDSPSLSNVAVEFLYELLHDRCSWNASACRILSQHLTSIRFLVTFLKNPATESKEKAEEILMRLCDEDEENIVRAAETDWYKPLTDRVLQGSEPSRISMVRALMSMELNEQTTKLLGERGIIPSLFAMANGNIESKELSLSVLVKLSACEENKMLIAAAGGVPLLLKLMFSVHLRTIVIAKCAEILEKLASNGDGAKFFVDETGKQLDLESIITNLLAFQQNRYTSYMVRRPALKILLAICRAESGLIKTAVLKSDGVLVLPLLDDSDLETRELAICLLFLLSQHEPGGVVEYLLKPRRLKALVGHLENDHNRDVQMAAAGLLANLPKSEESLTQMLIESNGLSAIVNILRSGKMEAKENALSVLFRFTDPKNVETQRIVVELGAYPLLVDFLESGSLVAKARAAALIGNLSLSTPKLTVMTRKVGKFKCFYQSRDALCLAHGGRCSVSMTFCMLEAEALPKMVTLLQEKVHATAFEVIQAISTIVLKDFPIRGASILHEYNAIRPTLEVLNWGSDCLKEEALRLLEKVFSWREMAEFYGSTARPTLVPLSGRNVKDGSRLQRQAARVLSLVERHSRSFRDI